MTDAEKGRVSCDRTLAKYEAESSAYYSSARLWDDGVLDPVETRQTLALGIAASLNAPIPVGAKLRRLQDVDEATAIKKLLVANRGEIALRVIRSAQLLGLKTVAVFSEADRSALHVAEADEARLIGAAAPSESYLNIDAVMRAAIDTGADAIHPGYGFLSERPAFARAVEKAGLIFVGPSSAAMEAVGDKVAARRLATEAKVPVVPGIETSDAASVRAFAKKVGYPILVKASAGGGGRGMRVVEEDPALEGALESAAREAQAAFGDGRIFIEKYLARPRHIEVQILGDSHGKIVALGERECSIQRRHQKLIEESPSVAVDEKLRARLCDAAVRLASAVGYQSAGTVEFLLQDGEFYLARGECALARWSIR